MKNKLAIHGGPSIVPDGLKNTWPEITQADKDAVLGVLESNILTGGVHGPEAADLETEWARYNDSKFALAFNSGTAALHTALFAAGVEPGDEVITSAFSFSGSYNPVLQQHAIPIFVDIDPRTFNLDVNQIENKITSRTKVIMPVHIHGLPADMDEVCSLAEKHNLVVIEDACQAHCATYKGKNAGTIGDMGCFSLNATKNLSGGEGGLMLTDNDAYVSRAKMFRTFGEKEGNEQDKFRSYESHTMGYNYRLQELPAAFTRSQLRRLSNYNKIAVRNGNYLSEELGKIRGLIPPYVPSDRTTLYHKYRLCFDPEALGLTIPVTIFRNRLVDALEAEGVATCLWQTKPMPAYRIFQSLDSDYGTGYPWRSPFYDEDIRYDPEAYPETWRVLDTSLCVNTEKHAITVQSLETMESYVAAFHKVFDNIDLLMD